MAVSHSDSALGSSLQCHDDEVSSISKRQSDMFQRFRNNFHFQKVTETKIAKKIKQGIGLK